MDQTDDDEVINKETHEVRGRFYVCDAFNKDVSPNCLTYC